MLHDDESAKSPPPPVHPKRGQGAVDFAAPKPGHDVLLHSLGDMAVFPVVPLCLSAWCVGRLDSSI